MCHHLQKHRVVGLWLYGKGAYIRLMWKIDVLLTTLTFYVVG